MSKTFDINEFDEVVPSLDGRRSNNTREWRDATDLELQQRDKIAELERELAVYEEQEQGLLWAISDLDGQRKSVSDELKSVSDQLAAAQAENAELRNNMELRSQRQGH